MDDVSGAERGEGMGGVPLSLVYCVFCGRAGALPAPNLARDGWVFVDCGDPWEGPGWQCPQCLVGYVE
jgi:hypothetical protein